MDKEVAQTSIKNVYGETFSLAPSTLVTLFEIDIGQIGFNRNLISESELEEQVDTVFRFHNNVKTTSSTIIWRNKSYVAAPISAEGFEITSNGPLPTPKLSMTVNEEGILHLAMLKDRIFQLGDIVGAKVTRIRTFARFLDEGNFFESQPPDGFAPDPNAELPRDIYYIERKSLENKFILEYELSAIFDIQGKKLPGRTVLQNYCPFLYRGNGCFYEYSGRRNTGEHDEEATLPFRAPPVADYFNEPMGDIVSGVSLIDRGEYSTSALYNSGEYCFIEHNGIKYYYVANGINVSTKPPNRLYWIPDECSHNIEGCKMRYGLNGGAEGNVTKGVLQFGGFPSVNRFR
jgi:lambda family phage minor tail protein L